MEQRICINGAWYVRETIEETASASDFDEKDVVHFTACVYETDDYSWEASHLLNELGERWGGLVIEFTDKDTEEHSLWDNSDWLLGVLEGHPESITSAKEIIHAQGLQDFRAFLRYLSNKGWL
jgi:hypothetical protein